MSWKVALILAVVPAIAVIAVSHPGFGAPTTATWDAARAAGFASYLLLWAGTASGIALHLRIRPPSLALTRVLEAHRMLSALGLSFVAVHVVALLADPLAAFTPLDAVAGLTSSYRPVPVAAGSLAAWLVAVVLLSTARAHALTRTRWRQLHALAFPAWLLALVHGIAAGSDSGATAATWLYAVTAATTAALVAIRLFGRGWASREEAVAPPAGM